MEMAKIDIRKLQMLNDRISQTIDALNQVRLSVHGLAHTSATPNQLAMMGLAQNPFVALANATNPAWSATVGANPVSANGAAATALGQTALGNPLANLLTGLSHTTAENGELNGVRPIDLALLARISQTFPFAYSPIPGSFNL